jgi:phage terminase large subunit
MADYEYAQEMECSFQAAVRGAFYGKVMAEADDQGRITDVPYDPALPVYTSCDLGIADAFAIWYWQISPGGDYRAIEYEEHHNKSLPEVIAHMRAKPYQLYEMHIAPHDIRVRELGTGTTRYEVAAQNGVAYQVAPRVPLMDGIEATRNLIRKAWFDKTRCREGINHLQLYRSEPDQRTNVLKTTPLHDHTSHGADAARYFATVMGNRHGNNWSSGINYDLLDKMAV